MPDHDPNGESWEAWKRAGYDSYETFIESKAGACPPESDQSLRTPDWPMPPVPDWSEEESDDPADQ